MTINKEVLKNLEQLPGLLTESADVEKSKKDLVELAKEVTSSWSEASTFLAKFSEGTELEFTPDKDELFKSCQENSLNVFGDWNEEAASFALAAYLSNEGTFTKKNDPEAKPNLEELFPLSEGKVDFELEATNKEVNALALEDFAGENKTFPIKNLAAALKLKETANTPDLSAKLKEFGVEDGFITVAYLPESLGDYSISVTLEAIKEIPQAEMFVPNSECLTESEMKSIQAFIDEANSIDLTAKLSFKEGLKPVELSSASVIKSLVSFIEKSSDTLATLVGITRKLGLTKEQLDEATEAYKVFSKPVLEKLLDKIPAKQAVQEASSISKEGENIDPSISKEDSSIIVESDPLAAPEQAPKAEAKSKEKVSWKTGLSFRPSSGTKIKGDNK